MVVDALVCAETSDLPAPDGPFIWELYTGLRGFVWVENGISG